MKNIYLIGFMGAGKSSVAREIGKMTGADCLEMDALIEQEQGMAITEIFERFGEPHFRDLETKLLRSFCRKEGHIISCGGGSVLREENVALMKENGCIVFLAARPETIFERVKDSTSRPVLNGNMNVTYIGGLMEKRRGCYEAAADVTVETDDRKIGDICDEILRRAGWK